MSHSIQLGPSGEVVAERHSGPTAIQLDRYGSAAPATYSGPQQAGADLAATEAARQRVLGSQQDLTEPPAPTEPTGSEAPAGDALPASYVEAAQALGSIVQANGIDLERVVSHATNTGSLPQQVQEQILAGFSGDASKANAALAQLEDRVLSVVFDQADALGVSQEAEAELFDFLGSPQHRTAYQKAWINLLRTGDTSGVTSLVRQFHQSSKK